MPLRHQEGFLVLSGELTIQMRDRNVVLGPRDLFVVPRGVVVDAPVLVKNLVDDSTRVMLRIKALFRARAILTPGTSVYRR